MQFSQVFAILAFTAVGAFAAPPPPAYAPPPPSRPYTPAPPAYRPPPPPPTINTQQNTCSSGSPFCCSPSSTGGTTCVESGTQCNAVSICCNNFGAEGPTSQSCSGVGSLNQPVQYQLKQSPPY